MVIFNSATAKLAEYLGHITLTHRWPLGVGCLLSLILLLLPLLPSQHLFDHPIDYLPLHTAMEFLAITIALMVFAIGFAEVGGQPVPLPLFILAYTFLGVGLIDFGHTLSFAGMPRFVTESDPEKAINFWLAARWAAAIGILIAALTPWRDVNLRLAWRMSALVGTLVGVAFVYWIMLYRAEWLPRTFIAGQGLTSIKVLNEYALCAMYALSAIFLWRGHWHGKGGELLWLAIAAWTTGLSELFFTLYARVTDIYNLFGHLYKDAAYLMVFYALFIGRVREPYARLRESQSELRKSLNQLARTQFAVDQSADIFLWLDHHGYILDANRTAGERLGFGAGGLAGAHISHIDKRFEQANWEQLWIRLQKDGQGRVETEYTSRTLDNIPVEVVMNHVVFEGNQYICAFARDISERKLAQQHIEYLAHHDALTGLANRVLLRNEVVRACLHAQRHGHCVALLFIDLDHFKVVNDSLGHLVGDHLLVAVAQRLTASVRATDIVSRTGGDEFLIALTHVRNHESIVRVAQNLLHKLDELYEIDGHNLTASFSIGISYYPQDGTDFETLLRKADAALYTAKRAGRKAFRFFEEHMNVWAQERLMLETQLRKAYEQGDLYLHYQPLVKLSRMTIVGAEALLRWKDATLGEVSPARFIPIAEETGLIVPIGAWVLREACMQAVKWQRLGNAQFCISVNLSALQLIRRDLIEHVKDALTTSGLSPACLELELTESALIQDSDVVVHILSTLSQMGVRLSIDDYGTGYSSLSYLKRFAVDCLKIDRSFVLGMTKNENDAMIVRSTIDLAHNLGLRVIAEGVETDETLAILTSLGCDIAQGFLLGRPVGAADFKLSIAKPT